MLRGLTASAFGMRCSYGLQLYDVLSYDESPGLTWAQDPGYFFTVTNHLGVTCILAGILLNECSTIPREVSATVSSEFDFVLVVIQHHGLSFWVVDCVMNEKVSLF